MFFKLQRLVLFPRFFVPAPADPPAIMGLERWWLTTAQGRVEAWFLPAEGASPFRPRPAVIFAHGNGELIDHFPHLLHTYQKMGIHVLLPEYRGYGRSDGSPTEINLAADYARFYQRLAGRPHVDRKRIIYHGRSIGNGVVCALAKRHPPAALIMMAAFSSIPALARRYLMPSFLVKDKFDNLSVVERYKGPVLLLHGRLDTLVGLDQPRMLARAAENSTLVIHDGGHSDFPMSAFSDIQTFLVKEGLLEEAIALDNAG